MIMIIKIIRDSSNDKHPINIKTLEIENKCNLELKNLQSSLEKIINNERIIDNSFKSVPAVINIIIFYNY